MVSKIFPFHVCATSHTKQKAKHIHTKQNSFTIQNKKKTGPILIFSPPPRDTNHHCSLWPSRPAPAPARPRQPPATAVWCGPLRRRAGTGRGGRGPRTRQAGHGPAAENPWSSRISDPVTPSHMPGQAQSHTESRPVTPGHTHFIGSCPQRRDADRPRQRHDLGVGRGGLGLRISAETAM